MSLQNAVAAIALVGIALVALGFAYVIIQAGKPADEDATRKSAHKAHVLQGWLFAVLLIGFIAGSWATLRHFPIPPQHSALDADQVVDVVGRQWSWQIAPATVETASVVEFRVTSDDVNHGFAIYSPDGRIVAQTQAMPGYTNKLLYTFDRPGTYTVHCLEYCGVGHGPMKATIQVVAAGTAVAAGATAAAAPTAPERPGDPVERGKKLVKDHGCTACHATTDARRVGPGWGGLYGSQVQLEGGGTVTADDAYIAESIRDPNAKVTKGYTKGIMPSSYDKQLSDADIDSIVAYIRSLEKP